MIDQSFAAIGRKKVKPGMAAKHLFQTIAMPSTFLPLATLQHHGNYRKITGRHANVEETARLTEQPIQFSMCGT